MALTYILGEPMTGRGVQGGIIKIPSGQISHARGTKGFVDEIGGETMLQIMLEAEYCDIVGSLHGMGVNFSVLCNPEGSATYSNQATDWINELGRRWVKVGDGLFLGMSTFPRDAYTLLPDQRVLLIDGKRATNVFIPRESGYSHLMSPYGEGGRVLRTGKILVAVEEVSHEEVPVPIPASTRRSMLELGLGVVDFPLCACVAINMNDFTLVDHMYNGHIDRVAALIEDKDGNARLIVGTPIETGRTNVLTGRWETFDTEQTLDLLSKRCHQQGVQLDALDDLQVPYSLNFPQFDDGRVLITAGEPVLETYLHEKLGRDKVHTTTYPIRCTPVYRFGGIRCLLNELPSQLLK